MPKAVQAILPIREWWLEAARERISKEERSLDQLGYDLAKWVPQKRRFDHGQLSRFKNGEIGATLELVIALCSEYDLIPPIFSPRSLAEATELNAVARKYDPASRTSAQRLADVLHIERPVAKRRAG